MTPLILVHGHGIDSSIWEGIKKCLPKYPIFTPDLASETRYVSIEDYAAGLREWLLAQGIERCVLVGHSMGGYITLAFAEKYPELLAGFGLFHSTAYADDDAKREQRTKTLRFMETHGAAAFIKQASTNMYAESYLEKNPEALSNHIQAYSRLPTDAVIVGFKAIMNRPDRTAVLEETSLPVLFIFGKEDKFIPFDKNIGLSELPKNAQTLVLAEVGHMGMFEAPQACADALAEFLKNIE
jgi:pimeloyl-ACP methyl ester carboxylesterase